MKSRTLPNIAANFLGRSWSSLMTLVCVPLYIKFLGIEAYGLIGFFVTLKALVGLLDLGLTTTLNREMARFSADGLRGSEAADTARTVESLYWGLSLVILALVSALSPAIAAHWINSQAIATDEVTGALRLMGVVVTLSFPFGLYAGGLMGLQRQVLINVINVIVGTFKGLGAVAALWLIAPTIGVFFAWQAGVAAVETLAALACFWRVIPGGFLQARFQARILRSLSRFAAGMTGIVMSTIVLTQVDKILLVKLLPLDVFGYYALAVSVAAGIQSLLVYPVANAVFPRLSQLVKLNQAVDLAGLYHRACQLVSVLIVPTGLTLVFFAREILFLWTRDAAVAGNARWIMSVVMAGFILNSATILPYMLQLSLGWTRLTLVYNTACIAVLIPSLLAAVKLYGAVGGATILVVQNACYLAFVIPRMHRRLLPAEMGRWYRSDAGLPLAAGLVSGLALRGAAALTGMPPLPGICVTLAGVGAAVLLASPEVRVSARGYALGLFGGRQL